MTVKTLLEQGLVRLDGGMGTLLQAQGLKAGELPERWNITHPDAIVAVHRAYFDAGSHIVNINTFGANSLKFSSEELAQKLETAANEHGAICLVIGSSHGLSSEVKAACDLRLSVSKLTFPHQLMRVLLLEVLYRSFSIIKGTKYHK